MTCFRSPSARALPAAKAAARPFVFAGVLASALALTQACGGGLPQKPAQTPKPLSDLCRPDVDPCADFEATRRELADCAQKGHCQVAAYGRCGDSPYFYTERVESFPTRKWLFDAGGKPVAACFGNVEWGGGQCYGAPWVCQERLERDFAIKPPEGDAATEAPPPAGAPKPASTAR